MNSKRLPLHGPLFRKHAHAGVPDDDRHANGHFGHCNATGRAPRKIDHDATIHFLVVHCDPVSAQSHFGPLVGGAVKPFGKRPGDVGRHQPAIVHGGGHGPVIGHLGQQVRQAFQRIGARTSTKA